MYKSRVGLSVSLLSSTTLATSRGLRPALSLNFLSGTLDPRITFSRSSQATVVGSNGLIQTAAINGPRFDHDPVTLAPKGLLIEDQRTNLLTYSEQFDNAAWVKSNATVAANAVVSPDGTADADKLVESATSATHEVSAGASVIAGTAYAYSVFAKQGGRDRFKIQFDAGLFPVTATAYFDLLTGTTFSVEAGATATINDCGSGWYRCTVISTATASGSARVYTTLVSTGVTVTYLGDGTSGIYLWGAQLEGGSFATSYIPTVASQVTRTADVATMTGANFSSWFNSAEGSFVTAADTYSVTSNATTLNACDANAGGVNERIQIRTSATGAGQLLQTSSGTINANITSGTLTNNTPYKVAVAIKTDDFAISANGGALGTDNLGQIAAPVELRIGRLGTTEFLNGHIRSITYYPTRLPNATLQSLTS